MEWTDRGIVLSARKYGESAVILHVLTEQHGRHAGLVRGGASSRARGLYQPGNLVAAHWRARLPEHLGSFTCELVAGTAAQWLDDGGRLAALSAACALADTALPEREPHADIYDSLTALLAAFAGPGWPAHYVRFELGLLAALGYGLDLMRCAATGRNDQLAYVSPKTGRAVSLAAGEPWRDQLLSLPAFLLADASLAAEPAAGDLAHGLALTGFFLSRHVFEPNDRKLPAARTRLVARLAKL